MSYCHVSRQCDDYAHKLGVEQAFECAVERRIEELTSKEGDFYPLDAGNFAEALGNLSIIKTKVLQNILSGVVNQSNSMPMLVSLVEDYWREKAEQQAIKELSQ